MTPRGPHLLRVRVYFEDTDAGGVVYHANYLGFAERARTEALRDMGVPHAEMAREHGVFFMVRRAKLDYLAPARLDDSLVVATQVLSIGPASVELRQSFHHETEHGRTLAVAEIRLACVRASDLRPARIPPRWRHALAMLVPTGGASPEKPGAAQAEDEG
jgi:acyl-CoA thioester hydrolase